MQSWHDNFTNYSNLGCKWFLQKWYNDLSRATLLGLQHNCCDLIPLDQIDKEIGIIQLIIII